MFHVQRQPRSGGPNVHHVEFDLGVVEHMGGVKVDGAPICRGVMWMKAAQSTILDDLHATRIREPEDPRFPARLFRTSTNLTGDENVALGMHRLSKAIRQVSK